MTGWIIAAALAGWIFGVWTGVAAQRRQTRTRDWLLANKIARGLVADAFKEGKGVRVEIVDEQGNTAESFRIPNPKDPTAKPH